MQYKEFIIEYEPVSGLNENNLLTDQIETEGRMCHVYGIGDEKKESALTSFLFVEGINYTKGDEQSFEETLKQTIDLNEQGLWLCQKSRELNKKVLILSRLIAALLEPVSEAEWLVMIDRANLTADELKMIGYPAPSE